METIIYQGREIQATKVNYISGAITTSTVDHEGDEDLFRDEAGRYYLRRQLSRLDSEGECRPASGRTLVHRINVNAAILWATTRLNSETLDLRADAAKLLMEGRGYTDPHPSHLSAEQRAMVSDPDRFAKQREPGSHRFTFDYSASRWLAARQAAPGFADLDDNARELLARHLAENPELDARDVLNGAVTFLLSDEVNYTTDAVNEARDRRVAREATGKHHVALCALLDDKAAALVRRYLEVTPWEFTAADIINGCVERTLSVAFINMAEAAEHTSLDSAEFHDGAWGYTEEDIVDATVRRTGAAEVQAREGWSKAQAVRVAKAERENHRRRLSLWLRSKPNPADVALLAASAPEEDPLPEEVHTDEPEEGTATPDGEEGK